MNLILLADHPTIGKAGDEVEVERIEASRLICYKLARRAPDPATKAPARSRVARVKPKREATTDADEG